MLEVKKIDQVRRVVIQETKKEGDHTTTVGIHGVQGVAISHTNRTFKAHDIVLCKTKNQRMWLTLYQPQGGTGLQGTQTIAQDGSLKRVILVISIEIGAAKTKTSDGLIIMRAVKCGTSTSAMFR